VQVYGAPVAIIIQILVIFVVLAILAVILSLSYYIFRRKTLGEKEKKE
jgi:Tfp pilus assembly protein PilE